MKEFQIAVCDDEKFYIEDVCQYFNAYQSERDVVFIVSEYQNPLLLQEDIQSGKHFDIIILDMDMPEQSGLDTAEEIRKSDTDVTICFITSYDEYAYGAFQVNAAGYLLKPVAYVPLRDLLDKCIIEIRYLRDYKMAEETYLKIRTLHDHETLIVIDNIIYLEKRRNQCLIHMTDGEAVCYDTLSNMYGKLDHNKFFYVHQGYIVNFNFIKEVLPDKICLSGQLSIPCSRKYYRDMRERHMDKIMRLRAEYHRESTYPL